MSYAEVYRFEKDGRARLTGKARDSHGFASYIWQRLGEKYGIIKDGISCLDEETSKRIWGLFKEDYVDLRDKIVLGATFDYAVIIKEAIPKLIEALRSFITEFPYPIYSESEGDTFPIKLPERVIEEIEKGTIVTLIEILESEMANPKTVAIAFNATSVNDNAWQAETMGKNDRVYYRTYNINKDDRHFLLFQPQ